MRAILAIALGHLRMEMKDRSNAFWMLVMPIGFIGLFGGLFGGGPTTRPPSVRVVDADQTFLSRAMVEIVTEGGVTTRTVTPAEADTIKRRAITLTMPKGFADSLSTGRRVTARFAPLGGGHEDRDMEAKVQVYLGVARMLAALAEVDTMSGPREARRDLESTAFQERFHACLARPDLIRTEVRTAGRGRTVPTGFGASAQAMLVLFLLMNASISGAVMLTQEKQARVLARLATYPVSRAQILSGKILGLLGMAMAQAVIITALGHWFFHVWWGPNPWALLLLLLCLGLAASSLGILLGGVLRTPEQAGAVGWLIPLFLGAIGGTWWPLEVTPSWAQIFGHVSPAAWAMDGMHGLINFGQGASAVWVPCLVLLLFSVVMTWVGSRLLRLTD